MPYKIGLTGNIGCGKSTVGAVLRGLGAEYLDADQVVHQLLAGGPLVEQVVARFGPEIRLPGGGVDRWRLGRVVFQDPGALKDLEAILHPAVRQEIRRRVAESTAPVVVVDAIKLIEGGLYREMDSVWVVICDPADQRHRLVELRGMTEAEAAERIKAQPLQQARLPYADVVVDNSGDLEATRQQVGAAWERLVAAKIDS